MVHTLVDIYNHIAVPTAVGLSVNFHFDKDDERVRVTSERGERATVSVVPKMPTSVLVRVPRWAPPDSVCVSRTGDEQAVRMIGDYAYVPGVAAFEEVTLEHALPVKRTTETSEGIDFEFGWKGDEITGVCPNTDFYPFYPTLEGCDRVYESPT